MQIHLGVNHLLTKEENFQKCPRSIYVDTKYLVNIHAQEKVEYFQTTNPLRHVPTHIRNSSK